MRNSVCARMPIASPATKPPRISARDAPRPAIADAMSACAPTAGRQAGHVAQRPQRREPEQRRARRRRRVAHQREPLAGPRARRKNANSSSDQRAARRARSRSPARAAPRRRRRRRAAAPSTTFRERDEDRIAGRMRLVARDVEVAHAEREVDRVDVFERRREEREVRAPGTGAASAATAVLHGRTQTGRSRSASFRLPRR